MSAVPSAATPSPSRSRGLSLFDTFCLGVNAIIGSGIFLFPGQLAQECGPASIAAFGVCGILLVTVALCYAELGSMFRQNGGPYVYAKAAFGQRAGFGVGWLSWVTSVFSWAAVAAAVSTNLAWFQSAFKGVYATKAVALTLIVGFGWVNYRGIKPGAWTINFFTLAKLVPLVLFAAVGLFFIAPANYHPFWNRAGGGSFGRAVFLTLWALQGFEVTPLPAGETAQPQKAVPIAAVGSLVFTALLYMWIQAVAVGVYPGLASAGESPLAAAASRFLGSSAGSFMALGAVISMIGYNAGDALGCPRLLSALAEDKLLPARLALPHPRFGTPAAAILVTVALTAAAALFMSFQSLVDLANLAVVLQYLVTCAALVRLRQTAPHAPRRFRIPLGIPVALAGCAVSVWLAKEADLAEFVLAGAVIGAGLLARALFHLAG